MAGAADPRSLLCAALDVPDMASARPLISVLGGRVGHLKVGLQLFSAAGTDAVRAVIDSGSSAFVDLKLHDIPNTVRGAVRSLSRLGASLCTIHASGGRRMIEAAAAEARDAGGVMRIIAVTALTSLDDADLEEVGVPGGAAAAVERLVRLAVSAGADGCVMSPLECAAARRSSPPGFFIVTPGIRVPGDAAGDQARTAAPRDAVKAGSNLLVVGRPITGAADPALSAERFVSEIAAAAGPD
jgi:orotidine-5'-phosphate decarboxylase